MNMDVVTSSCTMAMFLADCANSQSHCDGFLFGYVTDKAAVISDAGAGDASATSTVIRLSRILVADHPYSFYDQKLVLLHSTLSNVADEQRPAQLLGWFQFRRNDPDAASSAEPFRVISHNFCAATDLGRLPGLSFALKVNWNEEDSNSPLEYQLYACRPHTGLTEIALKVENMGDTARVGVGSSGVQSESFFEAATVDAIRIPAELAAASAVRRIQALGGVCVDEDPEPMDQEPKARGRGKPAHGAKSSRARGRK